MTEKNLQPATEQVESTVPETAPQSSDVADPAVSEKSTLLKKLSNPKFVAPRWLKTMRQNWMKWHLSPML